VVSQLVKGLAVWKTISNRLHRISTTQVTLSAFVLFLLFSALVLPAQSARADSYAGNAQSPDTSFLYSADDLYDTARAYGEQGRRAYIRSRFTFDLIWPLVYTLFLSTATTWAVRRAFAEDSPWQLANLVPLCGAAFDYLENVSTSLVMLRYPSPTAVVDMLAPAFSAIKWILLGGSFVLLLVGILVAAWRWGRHATG